VKLFSKYYDVHLITDIVDINVTDTFCQSCGIYSINDLEYRLEVIQVIDFRANRKHAYDFLLVNNSNLGPILPRFRDITTFVRRKPLFRYSTPIPAKMSWSERTPEAN